MSKQNAEKFCSLYEQHKAMAKRLAGLNAKSDDALVSGLVKIAKDMGMECTADELKAVVGSKGVKLSDVSGGNSGPSVCGPCRVGENVWSAAPGAC